jgi:hypothetical protein
MQETNFISKDIKNIDRDIIIWYRANNVDVPPNQPIRNTHAQRKRRVDNARRHANGEKYDKDGKYIHRGYQKSRICWSSRRNKKEPTEEEKHKKALTEKKKLHKIRTTYCEAIDAEWLGNNKDR